MGRGIKNLGLREPKLYVYHQLDKVFYVKGGDKHRKGIKTDPQNWFDARQVVDDPVRGPIIPGPPAPDPKPLGGHVGPPLPPPELSPEEKKAKLDKQQDDELRERMRVLIQEELRANKRSQEMEAEELAELLSRKLKANLSTNNHSTATKGRTASKPIPNQSNTRWRFAVQNPEEYYEDEFDEEDDA